MSQFETAGNGAEFGIFTDESFVCLDGLVMRTIKCSNSTCPTLYQSEIDGSVRLGNNRDSQAVDYSKEEFDVLIDAAIKLREATTTDKV